MFQFFYDCVLVAFATSLVIRLPFSSALEFPRSQNASTVAFMDEQYGLDDLAGENEIVTIKEYAEIRSDIKGPFGEINSCWGISQEGNYMCDYDPPGFSRTIALYFYTPATVELGPIFRRNSYFNVNYNKRDLEFKGMKSDQAVDQLSVVKDFLVPDAWNFIAFNDNSSNLNIYNEEGSLLESLPSFDKYHCDKCYIKMGYYEDSSGVVYMKKTDAFACLYVYNATLTGEEISQIPRSCNFKGNPPLNAAWPQGEHLVGLWPLSLIFGHDEISGNLLSPTQADVQNFTVGPHGNADSAAVASEADSPLLKIASEKMTPPEGSFTVALWFSPQGGHHSGALFEFLDQLGTSKAFQFHYNGSNVELRANNFLSGRFPMVQPRCTWTFLAVTLENHEKLTVYGDHGMVGQILKCTTCANSLQFSTGGITLGHSARWGEYIQVGDTVSCLAFYHLALNDMELQQLKDGCRIVNSAVLSGQPRLPLSPLPDVTHPMSPKIPENGQFPWLGALQYKGHHICSATIVNSLWILTSAICVLEDPHSVDNYGFLAGSYNLALTYEHQQYRNITEIAVSGDSSRDLALLQLEDPLDMVSDYVSDAYIARGGELYTNWHKDQLMVGWGINGRSPLDSPTLPRYVAGMVLTDNQCQVLWPDNYNSTFDYCFTSLIADQNVPCHGDEGSPVLVQTDGDVDAALGERLLQIGVYRGRDGDCSMARPGLFTRTAPFADWITSVIDRV